MPIQLTYEAAGSTIVLRGSGTVTGAEILAVNEEIYAPERISAQRCQLVDFTAVDRFDISTEEVRALAAQDRAAAASNPGIVIAIAGEADLLYGLARLWQVHVDEANIPTHIVSTVAEAREWLGHRNP